MVAQAPVGVVTSAVDVGAVGQQVQRIVEVGAGVSVVAVVGVDTPVEVVEFTQDAVLFSFEDGQRDGVGVVGLHEPVLFVFEPVTVLGEAFEFVCLGGHEPVELVVKHPGQGLALGGADLHAGVVVLDQLLHVFDQHRLASTVGAFGVPARAYEVAVDLPVPVLGVGHDEPGPALAAVDGAFEVVVVDLGGLGGGLVRGEHGLDLVPDLRRHEHGVGALVAGAAVDDIALVVGVGQQPVHRGDRQRLRWPLRGGHADQAPGGQFVVELADGPVAGGVGLERPLDQRCAFGVEFDGANLTAHLVAGTDVEVADGGLAEGAAADGLLGHAFGDLGCQVPGVELCDGRHDAVQQHPGGGLVDVLGGRDEHDPGLLKGEVDGHVVGAVAGEPVDLVDDAVGDFVGLDVLDHPHQVGPVGGLGRGSGVDELLHDRRAELVGFAAHRVALGGDGEAFVGAALGCLFTGGDPQVGDRDSGADGRVDQARGRISSSRCGGHRVLASHAIRPSRPQTPGTRC
ncbi:hypothetical protein QFE97_00055 [Bacillus subtilis]|nr:hypothetical protein QFE97_00055 [Bacillus subtilis]